MSLPFLVLDLLFYRLDCALRLNLHGFSLSGEGLDEDLHTTTKPPYKVKGRFLLDVVLTPKVWDRLRSGTVLELQYMHKRKTVAQIFWQKSALELEPDIWQHVC